MSDVPSDRERDDAAREAAQNVVDEVTSWEYSAEPDVIASRLDEGLREAEVEVEATERHRIIEQIDEVKHDETRGAPDVERAEATQQNSAPE